MHPDHQPLQNVPLDDLAAHHVDPRVVACARAAHEANRIYCMLHGDTSHKPWHQAPDWAQQSAVAGVACVIAGKTPEQLHESWLAEKRRTGWRYGPIKDAHAKEHPCMVPYAELPDAQRNKDALYVGVVTAMAQAQT